MRVSRFAAALGVAAALLMGGVGAADAATPSVAAHTSHDHGRWGAGHRHHHNHGWHGHRHDHHGKGHHHGHRR